MPTYNEDPARILGAACAMMRELDAQRRRRRLRPLHPQRHHPGRRLDRRAGDRRRRPRRPGDRPPHLLPPPQPQPAAQGRQHRRLGRALGRRLRLHAGARRRQPDGGALHRRAGPADGRATPTLGLLQTAPQLVGGRTPVRPRAAVRRAALRPGARPRPARLVVGNDGNYWGHNAIIRVGGLRRVRRPAAAARQAAVRRPHPQPRLRRGRAARAAAGWAVRIGRRPAAAASRRARRPCSTSPPATAAGARATCSTRASSAPEAAPAQPAPPRRWA